MKVDPVVMYVIIGVVVLLIYLYDRHFARKQEEAFAAVDLKTIKKHFEGRCIEFKGCEVDLRFPDSEGCKKCESGYHICFETDADDLMCVSTVGHRFMPLNWQAPYPYFDYNIWDQPFAVAVKDRAVFERQMSSIKIKNAIVALFKKKDGQLLRGFLTVREETHITVKGLKKKQEVRFSSVPINDFLTDPHCLIAALENLFHLIEEVRNFKFHET